MVLYYYTYIFIFIHIKYLTKILTPEQRYYCSNR
ncbi:hypothetical protein J4E76_03725 [Fabibacter sp. E12]|nr:hypothetical protein [Roseivirga sp. E12]